jgi:hypothetical protein
VSGGLHSSNEALEAFASAERWPEPGDLPRDLSGKILYNLCWVSEAESENLRTDAVPKAP